MPLEFARANAHERNAVAVVFVMFAWILNEGKPLKSSRCGVNLLAGERVGVRQRARRQRRNSFRKTTPKFVSAEPKNTGESCRNAQRHSRAVARASSSSMSSIRILVVRLADELRPAPARTGARPSISATFFVAFAWPSPSNACDHTAGLDDRTRRVVFWPQPMGQFMG